MSPGEIREKFLDDHAHLRGKASVLRSLATQVLRGDRELGEAMRLKGQDMQIRLVKHMQWEERELLPFLRGVDSLAADMADQIFEEHRSQRAKLADSLIALEDGGSDRGPLHAEHLLEFIRWLERDMEAEESRILEWLDRASAPAPASLPTSKPPLG